MPELMAQSPPSRRQDPIHLIIRFATSQPDISLVVHSPQTARIVSLKPQVRSRLPLEIQTRRLRFIYAGKFLSDDSTAHDALRPISLLPSHQRQDDGWESDHDDSIFSNREGTEKGKGKGKASIRDGSSASSDLFSIYIHCSIGDVLSPPELEQEAAAAAAVDSATALKQATSPALLILDDGSSTISPPPRGFDRLLDAGLTAQEVSALRAQFLQLQMYTHTPDTMPTAFELRLLEDRWLDDSAGPGLASRSTGDGLGDGINDAGAGPGSALDDMLWGNVLGFFWPLGAIVWILREDGVWSSRRQMAVFTGILVNIAFSVLHVASSSINT